MTRPRLKIFSVRIIPYQELLGNYDCSSAYWITVLIIPYQELLGNYDFGGVFGYLGNIIPYQELLGNYDLGAIYMQYTTNYTIPRAIRELWL